MTPAANGRRGHTACQKSLAEFAARRWQRIEIIFSHDMCVRENTSQAASVEFVRLWHTNYVRSRPQPFVGKTRRVFPTVSMTPAANGRRGHALFSAPVVFPPHIQQRIGAALLAAIDPPINLNSHMPVKAHSLRIRFVHCDRLPPPHLIHTDHILLLPRKKGPSIGSVPPVAFQAKRP